MSYLRSLTAVIGTCQTDLSSLGVVFSRLRFRTPQVCMVTISPVDNFATTLSSAYISEPTESLPRVMQNATPHAVGGDPAFEEDVTDLRAAK